MTGAVQQTILLFSYGTLRQEAVQLATFGRRLEGREDALPGYRLSPVRITDPHVIAVSGADTHTIARPSGDPEDRVQGMVYEITAEELEAADRYEVGDYERVRVRLESGAEAYLYVAGSD
jgi:gamma-glutamylcyclotransferase (GGCT)/AIG2-like uncharacterized protein YtfP